MDARAYELVEGIDADGAASTDSPWGGGDPRGQETLTPERAAQFVRWAAQVHGVTPRETPVTAEQIRARALAWTVLRLLGLGPQAISRLYGVNRRRVRVALGQTAREPSAQEAAARWQAQFLDLVGVRRS